ncbi:MalY/PatB family protein [Litoribrevibacter albus]|uniref:cysteine-S-conjugate beta-lyase n=1 Tax=Litoribrevibacter albus TaxID=1473156 RepID=A0AA37S8T8_9GAMM|nr:PatB family C-S lyase [Litoribrevibacter albus]GLQ30504.1 aspartate aminotransferase [Litoribrevibacter albus]
MNGIDFNHTIDRTQSSSMKWEKYRGKDVLPMWVADSDFRVADEIIDALKARADHGIFGYTLIPDQLIALIIERMSTMYNWQVKKEDIVFIPGLVCGLNLVARAYAKDGKKVGIPKPIYPPFVSSVSNAGAEACFLPFTNQDGRWMIDWSELEANAAEIHLLMLCNPQNPGGTVFRREELNRIAELAEQHDWIVCSDEIHCDLLLDDLPHVPFASVSEAAAQRSCILMAPSKTWNIAGLGCSFAVIQNPALRMQFRRQAQGIVPEVNLMAIEAAVAAYEHGEAWLAEQMKYLRDNRDYIEQQVADIDGLSMLHTEATFLAWIDASALGLENPAAYFEEFGVGMSPGRDFGWDQFIRLNFGCQRALLEEALERIKRAIAHLPK